MRYNTQPLVAALHCCCIAAVSMERHLPGDEEKRTHDSTEAGPPSASTRPRRLSRRTTHQLPKQARPVASRRPLSIRLARAPTTRRPPLTPPLSARSRGLRHHRLHPSMERRDRHTRRLRHPRRHATYTRACRRLYPSHPHPPPVLRTLPSFTAPPSSVIGWPPSLECELSQQPIYRS